MDTTSIQQKADQCVKCGLCLPHCPTYLLFRDEAESPRGRIALIQGVASGQLKADNRLLGHLDNCLLCRRCEGACPSDVEYGAILDEARTELTAGRHGRLLDLLTSNRLLDMALAVGRGVGRFLPQSDGIILAKLLALVPQHRPFSLKTRLYPALSEPRGHVQLFAGCIGRHTDAPALQSLVALLTSQGFSVSVPPDQACCGAMHAHAGERAKALAFVEKNRKAFGGKADAILVTSSGCGLQLQESLGSPVFEATAFVAEQCQFPKLPSVSLRHTAFYIPCSLHAMQQAGTLRGLLTAIGGGAIQEISGLGCCGGAGMHLLTHPDMARSLADPVVERVRELGINTLLTTNSGCSLHLGRSLADAGLSVTVMHPLEWLQQQLEANP
ncbi:MAG: (Fe-S)-binding protein [Chromatiales bacterium]